MRLVRTSGMKSCCFQFQSALPSQFVPSRQAGPSEAPSRDARASQAFQTQAWSSLAPADKLSGFPRWLTFLSNIPRLKKPADTSAFSSPAARFINHCLSRFIFINASPFDLVQLRNFLACSGVISKNGEFARLGWFRSSASRIVCIPSRERGNE